jgi:hypothetical protein
MEGECRKDFKEPQHTKATDEPPDPLSAGTASHTRDLGDVKLR